MVTLELRLFADYHQIHIFDEGSQADVADAWTEEAVADNIAVAGDAIAVGTAVNGFVAVRVELLDLPPVPDTGDFDHVVEGSMQVRSGRLVVMGSHSVQPTVVVKRWQPDAG